MNYITKEVGLDNMTIPHGVTILYSIWTIKLKSDMSVVFHDDHDTVNLTSRIFSNIFQIGKTYEVTLSMVRTDGPTIATEPFEVTIVSTGEITDRYHLPAVVDTPVLSYEYTEGNVPTNNILVNSTPMLCNGNAVHKSTDWWLVDDNNILIWESTGDESNLTSIRLTNLNLSNKKFYTLNCVYTATNRDSSAAGSITFTVNSLEQLELGNDLNSSLYGFPLTSNLKTIDPEMTVFNYELWGEDKLMITSGSNSTGLINIPTQIGDVDVLRKDIYGYYNLKVKATINSVVVGWKDNLFIPTSWIVESNVWNDTNFRYKDNATPTIFRVDSFGIDDKAPVSGRLFQLPDGNVLMPRGQYQYGLYNVLEGGRRFSLLKTITIAGLKTTNLNTAKVNMLFQPLPNGKILFCPDTANLNAYLYTLDYTTAKTFIKDKEINLVKADVDLGYTEFHYLGENRVLMCTVKDNVPTATNNFGLRILDTSTGAVTVLTVGTHAPISQYSSLLRVSENSFVIHGSTVLNPMTKDGRSRTLTVNPDNTFTLGALEDARITPITSVLPTIDKRLKSIMLRDGRALMYTPYYTVSGALEPVYVNILNSDMSAVERTIDVEIPGGLGKDNLPPALDLVVKLNDGTICILNNNTMYGILYK